MKIGVDLRALQIGHQYRGIGEVAKQCLNRIFKMAVAEKNRNIEFYFYEYDSKIDPKRFLDIPQGLKFEMIKVGKWPPEASDRPTWNKLMRFWRIFYGRPIPGAKQCDSFLQFDFTLGVPLKPKTILIAHDLIPFLFWKDYFTSPMVHFRHKAARTTLRTVLHNYEAKRSLKRSHKNAHKILCVSENTRQDIHKYLRTPLKKMEVNHLGVSLKPASTDRAVSPNTLPAKPFLLFVGGIDKRRRRVDDIIAAFNNLKGEGHDIQLVLVGENFKSPEEIPDETVRESLLASSYKKDILTLGYIDDVTKQKLYEDAIAFVFPTIYEGFGIPVLEAMLYGCPVIAYKNSSIPEVGGEYVFYAHDWEGIWAQAEKIMGATNKERQVWKNAAQAHAKGFSWEKTSKKIYTALISSIG